MKVRVKEGQTLADIVVQQYGTLEALGDVARANDLAMSAELVARISDIPGIEWIRLHYAYPSGFPKNLLPVIRERENVCNYLDMAIQHSETKMLKLMRRGMTRESLSELIGSLRSEVPGLYLRTTVMVGHPGETESDFESLLCFIDEQRFERLGVFRYSHQAGSYSHRHYEDNISQEVKNERARTVLAAQNRVLDARNQEALGKEVKVIVDSARDGRFTCRSQYSTPMADPIIIVRTDRTLAIGDFYKVRITDIEGKNLIATL